MKHPYDVYPNDKFITFAIPTFCRPYYLEKALDSLEEHADMPYEVVVHDDGSSKEFRDAVFDMSDRISTVVFNNGMNTGLVNSANRAIGLASSKYIVFMADDCYLTGPCLKDMCNALSKPYVGIISPINEPGPLPDEWVHTVDGTRFCLSSGLGGGAACAFRKEVWEEVGGFDYRSPSSQSDNVFIFKILVKGYWKAMLEGKSKIDLGNYVYGDDYKPTEPMMRGRDCSFPKIFGVDQRQLDHLGLVKRQACDFWCNGERTIPDRHTYDDRPNPTAGLNDIPYWGDYFTGMFGGKNSCDPKEIVWEKTELHNQIKWKEEIMRDFRLEE